MAESVGKGCPHVDISVNVVWIPMVATDNAAAARKASGLFLDARVQQFWDAYRRCGTAYARHTFPRWANQAFSDLAANEVSRATMYTQADTPPEQWPAWDIVLFYERGPEWLDHPPKPALWACQHEFYGIRPDGTSGLFWRDDFAKPPFPSDWFAEVSRGVAALAEIRPA